MSEMLMETYLRQQVDKGEYGVAIIQAQIALDIANYIEKHRQPTIEPERPKGKWIRMSDADGEYYCCNQCGEELPRYMTEMPSWDRLYPHKQSISKTDFCSNCGADMRGEQE